MKAPLHTCLHVLLLISLAACSTGPTSHDPAVARSRGKVLATRKTYISGALLGAAVGGGAGAILGNQSHSKHGTEIGAISGALLGAAAGLLYARHVVHQRQAFQNAADYLAGCGRIAREQEESVASYNRTLDSRSKAIAKDEALLRGSIEDTRAVKKCLVNEIDLQEHALAEARAEGASRGSQNAQVARIAQLKQEERRIEAALDRMTQQQEATAVTERKKR